MSKFNISRAIHKAGFQLKKHSPEIMVVAGVVGTVASAVLACRATTKVSAVLEKTKEQVDGVHRVLETPALQEKYVEEYGVEYTAEESKKDLAIIYAQTGLNFVKLYGPAVLLGTVSIASILTGHNILRKRNLALAAAYTAVDKGFKEYRGRVVERFGEKLDKELRYNIKSQEIEETVMNEDGTESTVKKTVQVADISEPSVYGRCFDETNPNWERSAEQNRYFLQQVQAWANQKLQSEGYLFLNEVYEALGFDKTKAGHVVGWALDNEDGDGYVDFCMFDLTDENKTAFINGKEKSIWLDFNVEGNVYNIVF